MTRDEFQQARKSLGLSDEDLARMIGIAPARAVQTFSDWRCGVRNMDAARARLIRAYLDGYRPEDWPG